MTPLPISRPQILHPSLRAAGPTSTTFFFSTGMPSGQVHLRLRARDGEGACALAVVRRSGSDAEASGVRSFVANRRGAPATIVYPKERCLFFCVYTLREKTCCQVSENQPSSELRVLQVHPRGIHTSIILEGHLHAFRQINSRICFDFHLAELNV